MRDSDGDFESIPFRVKIIVFEFPPGELGCIEQHHRQGDIVSDILPEVPMKKRACDHVENLQQAVVDLIKSVNKKPKGFSRKESVAYYKSITERAWQQVSDADTPEIKSKYFDQGLEWMMMDEKFGERTTDTFRSGPVFMPPWWAYYRPWVPRVRTAGGSRTSTSSSGRTSGGGGGRQVSLPTLPGAAFAGTLVSGVERTAGGLVSKLESFTSGITNKTNPVPKTSSSGSRSSSFKSGGCACACACACAGCACACAGGGR